MTKIEDFQMSIPPLGLAITVDAGKTDHYAFDSKNRTWNITLDAFDVAQQDTKLDTVLEQICTKIHDLGFDLTYDVEPVDQKKPNDETERVKSMRLQRFFGQSTNTAETLTSDFGNGGNAWCWSLYESRKINRTNQTLFSELRKQPWAKTQALRFDFAMVP